MEPAALKESAPAENRMNAPERDQVSREVQQGMGLSGEFPIKPRQFVVLTIGIVVPPLAAADLVSAAEHRDTLGQERGHQHVPFLSLTQLVDGRIVRRSFRAVIPTEIVVGAVAVLLAVRLIVFLVIGDQVVERKAVMRGDKIDAGVRPAPAWLVQVAAAGQSIGHFRHLANVPAPITSERVSVFSIPLSPPGRKLSHLIAAFTKIPWFGDKLNL